MHDLLRLVREVRDSRRQFLHAVRPLTSRQGFFKPDPRVWSAEFADEDLESLIYPHPISGPLDVRQRLEFLRFHMAGTACGRSG